MDCGVVSWYVETRPSNVDGTYASCQRDIGLPPQKSVEEAVWTVWLRLPAMMFLPLLWETLGSFGSYRMGLSAGEQARRM
jgi:hypothetical protein